MTGIKKGRHRAMESNAKRGRKGEPEGQQIVSGSSEEELELETGDSLSAIERQMAGMEATITKLATALDKSSRWQATPTGKLKQLQGRGKSTGIVSSAFGEG